MEGKTMEGKTMEGKTMEGKTMEVKTTEGKITEVKSEEKSAEVKDEMVKPLDSIPSYWRDIIFPRLKSPKFEYPFDIIYPKLCLDEKKAESNAADVFGTIAKNYGEQFAGAIYKSYKEQEAKDPKNKYRYRLELEENIRCHREWFVFLNQKYLASIFSNLENDIVNIISCRERRGEIYTKSSYELVFEFTRELKSSGVEISDKSTETFSRPAAIVSLEVNQEGMSLKAKPLTFKKFNYSLPSYC